MTPAEGTYRAGYPMWLVICPTRSHCAVCASEWTPWCMRPATWDAIPGGAATSTSREPGRCWRKRTAAGCGASAASARPPSTAQVSTAALPKGTWSLADLTRERLAVARRAGGTPLGWHRSATPPGLRRGRSVVRARRVPTAPPRARMARRGGAQLGHRGGGPGPCGVSRGRQAGALG